MTDQGTGGAQAGGVAIFAAVGTAGGTGSFAFNISLTPTSRIVVLGAINRVVNAKRFSEG